MAIQRQQQQLQQQQQQQLQQHQQQQQQQLMMTLLKNKEKEYNPERTNPTRNKEEIGHSPKSTPKTPRTASKTTRKKTDQKLRSPSRSISRSPSHSTSRSRSQSQSSSRSRSRTRSNSGSRSPTLSDSRSPTWSPTRKRRKEEFRTPQRKEREPQRQQNKRSEWSDSEEEEYDEEVSDYTDEEEEEDSTPGCVKAGTIAGEEPGVKVPGLRTVYETNTELWEEVKSGKITLFKAPKRAYLSRRGMHLDRKVLIQIDDGFIGELKDDLVAAFPMPTEEHLELMSVWSRVSTEEKDRKLKLKPILRCGVSLINSRTGFTWEESSDMLLIPQQVTEEHAKWLDPQFTKKKKETGKTPKDTVDIGSTDNTEELLKFLKADMLDTDCHTVTEMGQKFTTPVGESLRKADKEERDKALNQIKTQAILQVAKELVDDIHEGSDIKKMRSQARVAQKIIGFIIEKEDSETEKTIKAAVKARQQCREEATKRISYLESGVLKALRNGKIGEKLFEDEGKERVEQAILGPAPRKVATTQKYEKKRPLFPSGSFYVSSASKVFPK